MLRLLGLAALLLIAWWALLFAVQRRLMFPAPPALPTSAHPRDAEPLWLETRAGRVEAWLLPPRASSAEPAPVLLFAHGNGELIDHLPDEFATPRAWGMAVLLVEYPGYGRSEGSPAQSTIAEAMAAAFDWIATRPDLDRSRIVAHGRSLGGGAVCTLLPQRVPAALILESTFADTRRFAAGYGAPGALVRDPFDNVAALRSYRGPLLLSHGEADEVIPIAHGEELARVAGVELARLPCGHNDCGVRWEEIGAFLRASGVLQR